MRAIANGRPPAQPSSSPSDQLLDLARRVAALGRSRRRGLRAILEEEKHDIAADLRRLAKESRS